MALNCTRGSGCRLGKVLRKRGDALARAAQRGGEVGVTVPGQVQELCGCGTEGLRVGGQEAMGGWLDWMASAVFPTVTVLRSRTPYARGSLSSVTFTSAPPNGRQGTGARGSAHAQHSSLLPPKLNGGATGRSARRDCVRRRLGPGRGRGGNGAIFQNGGAGGGGRPPGPRAGRPGARRAAEGAVMASRGRGPEDNP